MRIDMLTVNTSVTEFTATYYYKDDLVRFCRLNHIPFSGLMKVDLESNIIDFLGGKNPTILPKSRALNWVQDRLALDGEVTMNYRNNAETRAFFESIIGSKFRFCGAMMKYKETHPDDFVTYQDLVNIWYTEQENKKNGTPSTKQFYTANRYNSFMQQFFADPKNSGKGRKEMLLAWEEYKNSGQVNKL
jgi:hypothetical protein